MAALHVKFGSTPGLDRRERFSRASLPNDLEQDYSDLYMIQVQKQLMHGLQRSNDGHIFHDKGALPLDHMLS